MSAIDAGTWIRIQGTAAATAVAVARPCVFERIIIPTTKTGTVTFYDSASGTSALSPFAFVNTANTGGEVKFKCRKGLAYDVGGTTDLTIVVR